MIAIARLAIPLAVAALLLANCSAPFLGRAQVQQTRAACPAAGDDYFFPSGIFSKRNSDLDQFKRHWYSESLTRMGEPSLSCAASDDTTTYRFLWLRTFSQPISVRVSLHANEVRIEAFKLSGAGGYDPGVVSTHIEKVVTTSDWDKLEAALDKVEFWNLPTEPSTNDAGADGAQWIIEGERNGTYHVADRWSPEGPYRELGLLFLQIAGISVTEAEIY